MRRLKDIAAYICVGILIFLMLAVLVRVFTRQILIKRMNMDNAFTRIVFFDNSALQIVSDKEETSIDWALIYPFKDESIEAEETYAGEETSGLSDALESKTEVVTNAVAAYTTELFIGYNAWVKGHELYQQAIKWSVPDSEEAVNIIKMDNGYLTYTEESVDKADIEEIADSVQDFKEYLEEKGIPFYYINAGSKVDPEDKELSGIALLNENTNENADALLSALDKRKVSTVDMRELMKKDGLDWYQSYYVTDHHWTTRTGLWCASKIAELLNDNEGFEYDLSLFEKSAYDAYVCEDFWYGGQAVGIRLIGCAREDFEVFLPKYETQFKVSIPSREIEQTGSYAEAIIDLSLLEEISEYSDSDFLDKLGAYSCEVWRNDALGEIKNSSTEDNANKKILILQDSFGWYSSTFLACDTGEVDLIHPQSFTGSIREYIEQTKPDAVIMMFCERNIIAIDWTSHTSIFDLR